ncbi:MAG: hypothetical protein QNJ09_07290 [Paracoccaceae bacterium]|nr:hypothetical protein [Paracoccaceae bacterium]
MSAAKLFTSILSISRVVADFQSVGIRLEVGDDFEDYRRLRLAQDGRDPMYPMFDIAASYIDHSNGFWIAGFNPDGALVHTQAFRLLDMNEVTLREHLRTHRLKYITPGTSPEPDRTLFTGPPGLDVITGRVVYQGDFWLGHGRGGRNRLHFVPLLSRTGYEIVTQLWAPDYVFGLVPSRLAARGLAPRYGFTQIEPGVWRGPRNEITDEDTLCWLNAADIGTLLASEPPSISPATARRA